VGSLGMAAAAVRLSRRTTNRYRRQFPQHSPEGLAAEHAPGRREPVPDQRNGRLVTGHAAQAGPAGEAPQQEAGLPAQLGRVAGGQWQGGPS
jgi:hypothetical protein